MRLSGSSFSSRTITFFVCALISADSERGRSGKIYEFLPKEFTRVESKKTARNNKIFLSPTVLNACFIAQKRLVLKSEILDTAHLILR